MKRFLSITPFCGKDYESVLECDHTEEAFKQIWLSGGMPNTLAETNKTALTKFFTDAKVGDYLTIMANYHIRSAVIVRVE